MIRATALLGGLLAATLLAAAPACAGDKELTVGVIAYLTAVKATGSEEPAKVVAWMKSHPLDHFGKPTTLREDGRAIFDVELYQVKSSAESKYPWDYLKLVRSIPGKDIFPPLSASTCPFIKKG